MQQHDNSDFVGTRTSPVKKNWHLRTLFLKVSKKNPRSINRVKFDLEKETIVTNQGLPW